MQNNQQGQNTNYQDANNQPNNSNKKDKMDDLVKRLREWDESNRAESNKTKGMLKEEMEALVDQFKEGNSFTKKIISKRLEEISKEVKNVDGTMGGDKRILAHAFDKMSKETSQYRNALGRFNKGLLDTLAGRGKTEVGDAVMKSLNPFARLGIQGSTKLFEGIRDFNKPKKEELGIFDKLDSTLGKFSSYYEKSQKMDRTRELKESLQDMNKWQKRFFKEASDAFKAQRSATSRLNKTFEELKSELLSENVEKSNTSGSSSDYQSDGGYFELLHEDNMVSHHYLHHLEVLGNTLYNNGHLSIEYQDEILSVLNKISSEISHKDIGNSSIVSLPSTSHHKDIENSSIAPLPSTNHNDIGGSEDIKLMVEYLDEILSVDNKISSKIELLKGDVNDKITTLDSHFVLFKQSLDEYRSSISTMVNHSDNNNDNRIIEKLNSVELILTEIDGRLVNSNVFAQEQEKERQKEHLESISHIKELHKNNHEYSGEVPRPLPETQHENSKDKGNNEGVLGSLKGFGKSIVEDVILAKVLGKYLDVSKLIPKLGGIGKDVVTDTAKKGPGLIKMATGGLGNVFSRIGKLIAGTALGGKAIGAVEKLTPKLLPIVSRSAPLAAKLMGGPVEAAFNGMLYSEDVNEGENDFISKNVIPKYGTKPGTDARTNGGVTFLKTAIDPNEIAKNNANNKKLSDIVEAGNTKKQNAHMNNLITTNNKIDNSSTTILPNGLGTKNNDDSWSARFLNGRTFDSVF